MINIQIKFKIPKTSEKFFLVCASNRAIKNENLKADFKDLAKKVDSLDKRLFDLEKSDTCFITFKEQTSKVFGHKSSNKGIGNSVANAVLFAIERSFKQTTIVIFPENKSQLISAIDAAFSTNYSFSFVKKNRKTTNIDLVIASTSISQETAESIFKKRSIIMKSVLICRELVDSNADTVTPKQIANVALQIEKNSNDISVSTFYESELAEVNMPLLSTVGRGSEQSSCFIEMDYNKNTKSKHHIVLVGKGVTYDTGGLNLKPGQSMEDMRKDMAGAATVMSIIQAIDLLQLNIRVSALIPTCENAIGPNSYKPGDVYKARNGQFVEIVNTDAEGRLILSDALDYACKHVCTKDSYLINFATLTGSILVALGDRCAGLFSNSDLMSNKLLKSAKACNESTWRMPLLKELKRSIKSHRANIKNCGGRAGGSITAALFLEHFVKKGQKWAHFDIAGSSDAPKSPMYRCSASGSGIKTIIHFAESLIAKTPN